MTDDQLTAVAQCSQPQSHLSTTQCNSALPDPTPAPLEQWPRGQHFCQKLSKLATYIEVIEC